ncbi:unnamed protein product [Darwinula stevensoni]|uniref:PLAT domain-containing protein n=1 Tax=Darwinula stevensoni TaxID=69355 RepID=A0A7R9FU56_9CRUS|nr:unnamed protein product [Darwinula stevensoni]CAG0906327.1 unnamed protein product [Darwinula stevensoni]
MCWTEVTHVVKVVIADHQISGKRGGDAGRLFITLFGSLGSSSRSRLGDEEVWFEPGQELSFSVASPEIGGIEEILVQWEHKEVKDSETEQLHSQPRIIIDRVVVRTLEHRATASFCGRGRELASGEKALMRRDDNGECSERSQPKASRSQLNSLFDSRLEKNA